ncbi:MAG: hypothetical protein ACE5FD_15515, partial [Anaerolineae bacterium]
KMLNHSAKFNHFRQNAFYRHRMAASAARTEKVAITIPGSHIIPDDMGRFVVITLYLNAKRLEFNPVPLFRIHFRFFDFADHSIIHDFQSPLQIMDFSWRKLTKNAREFACVQFQVIGTNLCAMGVFKLIIKV